MIPVLSHIRDLLRLIIIPGLVIVFLGLLVIIIVLLRELQRLRSLQGSSGATSANQMYPAPKYGAKEGAVAPPLQFTNLEPSYVPQQNPTEPDKLLNDKRWLKLTEGCVDLFNDLDEHLAGLDSARQELAQYVLLQLQEILERADVELIAGDATFDRHRHQPERPSTEAVPGTPIIETVSPGFAIGRRVLRRARVRLAMAPSSKSHLEEA